MVEVGPWPLLALPLASATGPNRPYTLNWDLLDIQPHNLDQLDVPLTEDENILQTFGEATGLFTNMLKSELFPIHVDETVLGTVTAAFTGKTSQFPCRYLGLPLRIGRARRADEQILIDKVGAKLPGWKGRLLNKAGRLTLVSSILSSIPTYHLTVFPLSKWAIKRIDRIRRNFLWRGEDVARGGHCKVNWKRVCHPKNLGGLGIPDLANFARALRLRWLWLKWTDNNRPWSGFPIAATMSGRLQVPRGLVPSV
ncbi:uncharacterized protein C2845_PM16G03340 [Panicum miliaceum]|uniref:Uncharacterized protein n=1 Tax=Panicum miliaceum TaxID=4540 RepID=A0A3L6PV00_PANMI|nr:uncharacterized protein C2845_PM16G03340 [Panicum miliaceum]